MNHFSQALLTLVRKWILGVLYGFLLCLRMYDGKIKSHRLFYNLQILNIWISKEHMPPPNPKPSASLLIQHLARLDEFSWSFIHHILAEYLMRFFYVNDHLLTCISLMAVLLPNVLPFGCSQSKLITVQLLQISLWSQQAYLNHRSGSKNTQTLIGENKCSKEPTVLLFLCLGGILPGPKRPKVPPIIAVTLEINPETAVQS